MTVKKNLRKKQKNSKGFYKKAILGLAAVMVLSMACYQVSSLYIKSKKAKAAETTTEVTTTEEPVKTGWQEEDGNTYYYDENGNVMIGRFVIEEEKKIYYTDDSGAVTRIVDGAKPMIAITYDDGPSKYSSEFAELFDKYDSAATFFEVGHRLKELPSLKKEEQAIADSNSELANHTYNHKNLTTLSKKNIIKQIQKNDEVLRAFGETSDSILLRPPEGAVNKIVKKNCGAPIILWNVDTQDWKSRNAKSIYKRAKKAKDGDIILMHSLYKSTLNATKKLIPKLINKGYQLVTVRDLAEFRGGLENGEKYFSFPPSE